MKGQALKYSHFSAEVREEIGKCADCVTSMHFPSRNRIPASYVICNFMETTPTSSLHFSGVEMSVNELIAYYCLAMM